MEKIQKDMECIKLEGEPANITELSYKSEKTGLRLLLGTCKRAEKSIQLGKGHIYYGNLAHDESTEVKFEIESNKQGITRRENVHLKHNENKWSEGWDYGIDVRSFLTVKILFPIFPRPQWITFSDREEEPFDRQCKILVLG